MLEMLKVARTCMKNPTKTKQKKTKDPKRKIWGFFYKLNINVNTNIASTPHEYDEQNFKSVEE